MRLSKAWLIASKDFMIFWKKPTILYSLVIFELLVSLGFPFLVKYITGKQSDPTVVGSLINAFSIWFAMGAAILPVGIAAYSLVGEKVQRSLEPLLATPVTDGEILVGKGIAALLPAMVATYVGAVPFMVLVDVFVHGTFHRLFYPNWNIGVILLLLAPLVSLFSVSINVLISSRSSDVRVAQQLGSAIPTIPLFAIYLLSEIRVMTLTVTNLLLFAVALAVLDVLTIYAASWTFQRDEILTAWK
ncbi:MAG TPA: ABC transporter permease subunit [Nitrolancea sp.]|nr:ABC transporter permease subunit [Nitrolancea sp.]